MQETPQEHYEKATDEELGRLVSHAEFMVAYGNRDETVNRIAFESRAEFRRRGADESLARELELELELELS